MKNKTVKYKPGKITLYNRETDKYFRGSLVLKRAKKASKAEEELRVDILTEVLRENFSQNLDAIIQSLHIKNATDQVKTSEVEATTPAVDSEPVEVEETQVEPEEPSGEVSQSENIETASSGSEIEVESKSPDDEEDIPPSKPPVKREPSNFEKTLKEYWDLIDFPALFRFILGHFTKTVSSVDTTVLVDKLFYSDDKPETSSVKEPLFDRSLTFVKKLNDKSERMLEKAKNLHQNTKISLPQIKKPEIKVPKISIKLPSKALALGFLIIAILSISSVLVPLGIAKINSINQQARAEETARINQRLAEERAAELKKYEYDPSKEESIPKDFKLFIPKIGLESDISPSVDLDDEEVYKQQLLTTGVAHAKGSYFPGQSGSVFLFAHSTDTVFNIAQFNAKFFSLGELNEGDEINIIYRGKDYKYVVSRKTIIDPSEVDLIRDSGDSLILMTCTPPGTDWQRLIIFADEVGTDLP